MLYLQIRAINKYMNITNANNQLNHPNIQVTNSFLQTHVEPSICPLAEPITQKSNNLNHHAYEHAVNIVISQPRLTETNELIKQLEGKQKDDIQQINKSLQQNSIMEGKQSQCNNTEGSLINIPNSIQKQEQQHKDNSQKNIKLNKKIKKSKKNRADKNVIGPSNHQEISSNSNEYSEQNDNLMNNNEIQVQNQSQNSPYNCIICQLCQEPIIFATQTVCGHAFCEYCLIQYLLVSVCCPICGIRIRERKGATNKKIDQIVQQFCIHMGKQVYQQLKQRKEHRKRLKQQRKVANLYAGLQIDVRDDDYIWKKGRVLRTFNRISSENVRLKFIIIQYLQNYKKEQLSSNCSRIAKAGYYTNRIQIPRNALQLYLILNQEKLSLQKKQQRVKLKEMEEYPNNGQKISQFKDRKLEQERGEKKQQKKFQQEQRSE